MFNAYCVVNAYIKSPQVSISFCSGTSKWRRALPSAHGREGKTLYHDCSAFRAVRLVAVNKVTSSSCFVLKQASGVEPFPQPMAGKAKRFTMIVVHACI